MLRNGESVDKLLAYVEVRANPGNQPVTVAHQVPGLQCIGIGTDAAVFRSIQAPDLAFKVFTRESCFKKDKEAEVYRRLGESPYFSRLLGVGSCYLILSYEPGPTLLECIVNGTFIPRSAIEDVESAREYVITRGLNPRDIHLKNIILQDGRAKIIDVSEYLLPGDDGRWASLKRGYEELYPWIAGRPVPTWMVERVRQMYHQSSRNGTFSYEALRQWLSRWLR